MENFIFQNPTKLVFGKGTIARLGELIPAGKRVMVTFGGGSVRRNGVYDEVCAALAGRDTVEFWGIEPNPSIETLREAIALGKEREVDFLLAVGGGSVIDGTKLIAAGLLYDGDAWELVRKGASQRTVPSSRVGKRRRNILSTATTRSFRYSIPKRPSRCPSGRWPADWPIPSCTSWSSI